MAKRSVNTFHLEQEILMKLQRNKLKTVEDVLNKPLFQLMILLSLSHSEAEVLVKKLSSACLPVCNTAFHLLKKESTSYISFGDQDIDQILHGGVKKGVLTEIAGPAGVGKTQMCFHMSLKCIQGSLPDGVAYIDTEGAFRSERIVEMLQSGLASEEYVGDVLKKLHVFKPTSVVSLSEIFQTLELFCIENNVGLVIIDSIASLARKEFSHQSIIQRSKILSSWAAELKCLAHQLNIAVIVTNQVTSKLTEEEDNVEEHLLNTSNLMRCENQNSSEASRNASFHIGIALGNTWTHFVNTRLILQYIDTQTRQFLIAKSPDAPMSTKNYTIESRGVKFEGDTCYTFDAIDPNQHRINVNPGIDNDSKES